MKITFITISVAAALAAAPLASQAADKEVQKPKCACTQKKSPQVALFVSGRGVANQPSPMTESVTSGQTGQGGGVTFFTK